MIWLRFQIWGWWAHKRWKFKKNCCHNSLSFYSQLMAKLIFFSLIYHRAARRHYVSGPQIAYLGYKMYFGPQGPILTPRPKILGQDTLPEWVLLILHPSSFWSKKVRTQISGSLTSSTLKTDYEAVMKV